MLQKSKLIKKIPISDSDIESLKTHTPDLYNDMVIKYGEGAVKDNFLVEYVILTEDETPIQDSAGNWHLISRERIESIYEKNRYNWLKYLSHGVNYVKSKFVDTPLEQLGYIPLMTNHKDIVENRHGWMVGDSLKKEIINGIMVLKMNGLLISPLSKYHHITDNWHEVSPTLRDDIITELSYVKSPAQITNTSLSAPEGENMQEITQNTTNLSNTVANNHENVKIVVDNVALSDKIRVEIQQAKLNAEREKEDNVILAKGNAVDYYVKDLVRKNIISTGSKNKISNLLNSFSANDLPNVAKIASILKTDKYNPMNCKAFTAELRGNINIMSTKDERYLAFSDSHPELRSDARKMMVEFEKSEALINASFSAGDVMVEKPEDALAKALATIKQAGLEKSEIVKQILIDSGISASFSDVGSNDTGGIDIPDNTKLSAPTPEIKTDAQDELIKKLSDGFEVLSKVVEEQQATYKQTLEELSKLSSEHKDVLDRISKYESTNQETKEEKEEEL